MGEDYQDLTPFESAVLMAFLLFAIYCNAVT